jgi:hypothetical protein
MKYIYIYIYMKFNIYFIIIFSTFFSIIYSLFMRTYNKPLNDFLDPKHKDYDDDNNHVYNYVKIERIEILLKSSIISFIILIIFYFFKIKADTFINTVYMYICIYFLIIYFIYNLYPKKFWMYKIPKEYRLYLYNSEHWYEAYKKMRFHWHLGFIIGVIISIIISFFKKL